MSERHALSVAVEEDLLPLSVLLHQRGIAHRVYEEAGRQVLEVAHEEQVQTVRDLYSAWRSGALRIEITGRSPPLPVPPVSASWRRAPVTLALIALSVLGFLGVGLLPGLLFLFSFSPFEVVQGEPVFRPMDGQYWRLVTPVFMHFGILHIAFNSLWLWDLGIRVERVMGHFNMLMLFLVIAAVSNASQFLFGGPSLFGGMSGVVYGLLGFSWVAPALQPAWKIQPSNPIMLWMIGWLLFCMSGLVEVVGFGKIANAAHLGGLICGAALGVLFGLLSRHGDKASPPGV